MSVTFKYKASDLTQYYRIQYFDENNKEIKNPEIPYGLKDFGLITENEFWPIYWGNKGLTHKATAFWPKHNKIFYGYNIFKTIYHFENSLSDDNWIQLPNTFLISGKDSNWDFITAFWWIKTDEVYHVVEENKENPRIGKIYFIGSIKSFLLDIDSDEKVWLPKNPVSIE
jgi:hypothetical protein